MNKYHYILIILGLIALVFSCTKSKIEVPPLAEFDCDTIPSAYSTSIQPLITTNCATDQNCHGANSPFGEFTSYEKFKKRVESGAVMARAVNPSENTSPMPPSGLLPQSERLKLQCWIENGATLDSEPVDPEFCDTVDTKFSTFIKPLVDNHCAFAGCHGSGTGGRELIAYSQIKDYANRGVLHDRVIDTASGTGPMPQGGYLPKIDRDKIQCWIDKGALNN